MTPTHAIIALLLGIVCAGGVAFEVGLSIGRAMPAPSTLPANFDVSAAVVGEKAAKAEAASYQALLTRALDNCRQATTETH